VILGRRGARQGGTVWSHDEPSERWPPCHHGPIALEAQLLVRPLQAA